MATSKITELLVSKQDALLKGWIEEQLKSTTRRIDLQNDQSLQQDSQQFLQLLVPIIDSHTLDIASPVFGDMRNFLTELSKVRNKLGYSPTETATFVLSFKQPLMQALRQAHGSDAERLFNDMWASTSLLDKLGLFTTQAFIQVREEVIRRQQEDMLELSTPVVRLWDGVVGVPLIGTLDSNRTNMVMESLLNAIVETRSEVAIIDITGVPTVDTLVAQHLLKTVAATRLMGAECIISGIRPQIAQTMVHLQIDMKEVSTKATLAEALVLALKRTGYTVQKAAK